ncbi:helix-turn-helix domain-containing protein [Streptomyces sp. NPDC085466]|uniref:helix-turn-helix domain-containing protein n=1 Tax=Streptomyces sp. NPDC085466 TaxID=3365725 RepID=UPI0037D7F3ED
MDLLDTNEHDEDLGIEVFREALLSSSMPSLVTLEDDARRVQARMSRWQFGSLMLFTSSSTGWRGARHSRHLLMEGAPMASLALQTAGTGRFGQSGRQSLVRPGELMLNDLTIPYEFAWSGSGAAYALQLTYDVLGLPPDVVRRGAERLPSTPMNDVVRAHLPRLHADADVLSVLPRVLAYIRARLQDPGLSAERIASAHQISVRTLYGLCTKAGMSLEQWITERRLEGARAALVSPAMRSHTIERIAHAWGFSTPSHFSRRFRAAYGVTPRQWRAARLLDPREPASSSPVEGRKGSG